MTNWTKVSGRYAAFVAGLALAGCVGTELEVPAHHPGHPHARAAKLTPSTAFGPEFELRAEPSVQQDSAPNEHTGHDHPTGAKR
jgi:hypothetical protein